MPITKEQARDELNRRQNLRDSITPEQARAELESRGIAVPRPDRDARLEQQQVRMAASKGPMVSGMLEMGAGVQSMGYGIQRLWDADRADKNLAELEKTSGPRQIAHPIASEYGKVAGQVLSTLPLGMTGPAASAAWLPRLAYALSVGGTEMGVMASAEGSENIAGEAAKGAGWGAVFEFGMPKIFSIGAKLYKRTRGIDPPTTLWLDNGEPTPDFQDVLDKNGLTMNDLTDEAMKIVRGESSGDLNAAIRESIFTSLDIPSTRSQITRNLGDVREEKALLNLENAEDFRLRLEEQSAQFDNVSHAYIRQLGSSEDVGDSIKKGLEARITDVKTDATAAYKEVDKLIEKDPMGMPLFGTEILRKVRDPKTSDLVARVNAENDGSRKLVDDILIQYGVDTDIDRVLDWSSIQSADKKTTMFDIPDEVTPLTLRNFDEMRQRLNALDTQGKPQFDMFVNDMIAGLDDEVDLLFNSVEKGSYTAEIIKATKRARAKWREFKKLENPNQIVGTFTKKKRGDPDTDFLQADELWKNIKGGGKWGGPQNIETLVANLQRAGADGRRGLANTQAAAINDLVEGALTSPQQIGDAYKWDAKKFNGALQRIGLDKLGLLFKNNPEGLRFIKKMKQAGDTTLPEFGSGAITTPVLKDLMNMLRRNIAFRSVSGMTVLAAGGGAGFAAGGDPATTLAVAGLAVGTVAGTQALGRRSSIKRAIGKAPILKEKYYNRLYRYPNIMAVMGMSSLSEEDEK